MRTLLEIGLANAVTAGLLALAALAAGRWSRRPALVHCLWVLVLAKLVTPPLVPLHLAVLAPEERQPDPRVLDPGLFKIAAALVPVEQSTFTITAPVAKLNKIPILSEPGVDPLQADLVPPLEARSQVLADEIPQVVNKPVSSASAAEELSEPVRRAPPLSSRAPTGPGWQSFVVPALGSLWFAGSLTWLSLALYRIVRFRHLLQFARPAPAILKEQTRLLARRLGLRQCPDVLIVPGAVPPLLWVLGSKACLLFPESLLVQLSAEGRAALLVHELAHLCRRDHWVRILELIATGLYWWYPLVWLACRRLQAAEEECCDTWVVSELPAARTAYAGALLETVDFLSAARAALPPAASGFGRVYYLKRRLTMIVQGSTPRDLSTAGRLCVVVVAFVLLPLMPVLARQEAKPADAPKTETQQSATTSAAEEEEESIYFGQAKDLPAAAGQVWAVALAPDGHTLAVASGMADKPGALTIWDVPTKTIRAVVHEKLGVRGVAFSPDGQLLATADYFDKTAKLRDPRTGKVIRTLEGHKDGVNGVAFSPDGKTLATAGLDKTIKLWEVDTGKLKATLEGHTAGVFSVAFLDDNRLVSCGGDNTARIWDLVTNQTLFTLKGHKQAVEAVAASPDGKTVATASWDKTIKLWDAASGKELATLTGHTLQVLALAFSPDGKYLASGAGVWGQPQQNQPRQAPPQPLFVDVSGGFIQQQPQQPPAPPPTPGEVKLWDLATHKEAAKLEGHKYRVFTLTFSHDGQTLATGSWDQSARLWDVSNRKELASLEDKKSVPATPAPVLAIAYSPDGQSMAIAQDDKTVRIQDVTYGYVRALLMGHTDVVVGAAFSPDGKTLATASFDRTVRIWDATTGQALFTLHGHTNWVFAAAFSPDGSILATAGFDKVVRLWDPKTGREFGQLKGHRGAVRCLAFSPDGKTLATGSSDRSVRLWDLMKREEIAQFRGHEGVVRAVAIAPDNRTIASGGEDNHVRLWDIATQKQLAYHQHNEVVTAVAFSPRGRTLASGCLDRSIHLLDPVTLTQRNQFFAHGDAVTCLAWSPDGKVLAGGGRDRAVKLWAATARPPYMTVILGDHVGQVWFALHSPDGKQLATGGDDGKVQLRSLEGARFPPFLEGARQGIISHAFSPDGKLLATGTTNRQVEIWDLATGRQIKTLPGHQLPVWSVAFSPDGRYLASGSGDFQNKDQPGEIKVWDLTVDPKPDLQTGASTAEILNLQGHGSIVTCVAISPDGKTLASCSWDAGIRLWDMPSGRKRAELVGHAKTVCHVAFSADSKTLVSCGFDGMVKLWDTETGKEKTTFKAPELVVHAVALSPDGKTLAVGYNPFGTEEQPLFGNDKPGVIGLWDMDTGKERQRLRLPRGKVTTLAFSLDGQVLISGGGMNGQFGEVRLWDVARGRLLATSGGMVTGVDGLSLSPDGRTLGANGGGQGIPVGLRFWDLPTELNKLITLPAHSAAAGCAAFSPDSQTLATGGWDHHIKLWDTHNGVELATLKGHTKGIRAVAFSPDGQTLASASDDSLVKLWDVATSKEKKSWKAHELGVYGLAFAPDGKSLATCSGDTQKGVPGEVKLWDLETFKEIRKLTGFGREVWTLKYSPDGKYLAAGAGSTQDGKMPTVRVWEAATGKEVASFNLAPYVRCLAFTRDGKTLAAGSGDGNIRLWDVDSWKEKLSLRANNQLLFSLSFSLDGRVLVTASKDGTAKFWQLSEPPKALAAVKKQ